MKELFQLAKGTIDSTKADEIIAAGRHLINLKNLDKTPLYHAAENGNAEIVKKLLDAGADMSISCERQAKNPIHIAACNNHPNCVALLCTKAAQIKSEAINAMDNGSHTPLHEAVRNNNVEMIKILLENGANQEVPTTNPQLLYALNSKKIEAAQALIANEPDKVKLVKIINDARSPTDKPILWLAAETGNPDLLKALLSVEGVNIDVSWLLKGSLIDNFDQNEQLKPVLEAAYGKSLSQGNINATDGHTKLDRAVTSNNEKEAKRLVKAGASIEIQDSINQNNPIHLAIQKSYIDLAKFLIEHASPTAINQLNMFGYTPLALAAKKNYPEVIELLLSKGGNQAIQGQKVPLLIAIQNGNVEATRALIYSEPDKAKLASIINNVKGICDLPILWIAMRLKKPALLELLSNVAGVNRDITWRMQLNAITLMDTINSIDDQNLKQQMQNALYPDLEKADHFAGQPVGPALNSEGPSAQARSTLRQGAETLSYLTTEGVKKGLGMASSSLSATKAKLGELSSFWSTPLNQTDDLSEEGVSDTLSSAASPSKPTTHLADPFHFTEGHFGNSQVRSSSSSSSSSSSNSPADYSPRGTATQEGHFGAPPSSSSSSSRSSSSSHYDSLGSPVIQEGHFGAPPSSSRSSSNTKSNGKFSDKEKSRSASPDKKDRGK